MALRILECADHQPRSRQQQKQYGDVAKLYEQNLNSGKLPPEQVDDRLKALVQLNTAVKNYPKVMEFGDKWIKAGGKDVDTQVLIAQAHYLQKDYKNSISIMQNRINKLGVSEPEIAQVGSNEILLSDAVRLAGRAALADVPVTLEVTPGVPHVFQGFAAMLDEGNAALDRAATFLRTQFAANQPS